MAINTALKRRQALDFGKIRGTGMPIPSGLISNISRAHIINVYFEMPVVPPVYYWRNKNRVSASWTGRSSSSSSWKSRISPSSSWVNRIPPPDGNTQEI